jgi:hypothetical protein
MPELSRFFGIIIRMFSEPGTPHQMDQMAGSIPQKQRRLVEAWAELHQDELMADWALLHSGRSAAPIGPLK